jgi:aryl-alcohol dehydrogenase-like predicted oxidoreductase
MDVRILGPSGLRVSQLCLGTATFGQPTWGCDESESRSILDRFFELGGNFIDTANTYGEGASERMLGRLLAGRRDKVVLGTKYTASIDEDVNASGNHRKSLVRSLERSLRSLQTDYVDVLWVHAWDGVTAIDELMRALDDQVRAGKVLAVGISNAPAWMVAHANAVAECRGWARFMAIQNEYNLLERGAERELLPMSQYFGLTYVAWAPLAEGRLTGKYLGRGEEPRRLSVEEACGSAAKNDIVVEALAVARELGCAPSACALRWIIDRRPDAIPLLGARTLRQLEANLECLKLRLSAEQIERLNAVSAIDPGTPTGFMRSGPGRRFMWSWREGVPASLPRSPQPWWEL